ncbi:MAG: hypothetical protein ABI867_31490 [Kofleriaceae bacterium]
MRALVVVVLAACTPPPRVEHVANPAEGISVMVYAKDDAGYGVVDDRRWIEVANNAFTLDRIDPAAPLPTLVIEPIGGTALAIGTCVRDRIDTTANGLQQLAQGSLKPTADGKPATAGVLSPLVRCNATGRGRHLVRVLYVAPAIRYRGQHDITVTGDGKATVSTRFALTTPAWNVPANVALFDGMPGAEEPPHEVAHGTVTLDGGTAVLAIPTQIVPATLRRIYDGAIRDHDTPATDMTWGRESKRAVWTWLELEQVKLSGGGVRVHIALPDERETDIIVSTIDREVIGKLLRLPLWVDDQLNGARRHWLERETDKAFSQRFELSVSNAGDTPREVWIEERLRPARRRTIQRAWPTTPVIENGIARVKVTVAPHGTERVGFAIDYVE